MPTLFMETTEIPPEKTVQQIEDVLMRYGAGAILKEFKAGTVEAVSFKVDVNGTPIPFRLPCRWEAIAQILRKRANIGDYAWTNVAPYYAKKNDAIRLKARRVAWRQILRWVEAQMALVETNMVKIEEVFFPYIQAAGGQTLFELQESKGLLMLGSGE